MAISNLTQRLEEQSARYFDRPGFSSPSFIDADHIALLDDRNGVPQISVLDLTDGSIEPATTFGERVLTLLASSASGIIVFGMDEGGNEYQQIWAIAPGGSPRRLTTSDTSRHEPVSLSRDGKYVYFRSNARSVGEFDIERIDLVSGERSILLENAGQPMDFVPSADGSKLYVESAIGNLAAILFELDTVDGTIRNLTPGPEGATIFSIAAAGDDALWVSTNLDRDFGALVKLGLTTLESELVLARYWDVEAVSPSPD
ncbi:MAG TPA: hypothetical protein VFQ54_06690, partial [Thermomicrobiales bacterium]|nr:hypothetical protein [Thermomicrobiales bacterium]